MATALTVAKALLQPPLSRPPPAVAKSQIINEHLQIIERELTSANDGNVAEDLMQNHDVFLSTLRSHLTKLQVVRHFWEQNNIKGAIDATRKLSEHSVGTSRPDQYSRGENGDSHLSDAFETLLSYCGGRIYDENIKRCKILLWRFSSL
ncbi:hypothetical protein HYC85_006114 [Camellia sinensis]|uniref:Katanin p80 subunit C-terminal domain-containing protein n=1 Tax=Camellia sinensis TaxID=4442 RepID=A0A7J7I1V2_CAMSI|nr:hypothetical protein HYC85_006114 [Camellia sinensis]